MGIAVLECERVVKDAIQIVVEIDRIGHVRTEQDAARLIGGAVEFLVLSVEGDGQKRTFFPFNRLLRLPFLPDGRSTPPLHDIHVES